METRAAHNFVSFHPVAAHEIRIVVGFQTMLQLEFNLEDVVADAMMAVAMRGGNSEIEAKHVQSLEDTYRRFTRADEAARMELKWLDRPVENAVCHCKFVAAEYGNSHAVQPKCGKIHTLASNYSEDEIIAMRALKSWISGFCCRRCSQIVGELQAIAGVSSARVPACFGYSSESLAMSATFGTWKYFVVRAKGNDFLKQQRRKLEARRGSTGKYKDKFLEALQAASGDERHVALRRIKDGINLEASPRMTPQQIASRRLLSGKPTLAKATDAEASNSVTNAIEEESADTTNSSTHAKKHYKRKCRRRRSFSAKLVTAHRCASPTRNNARNRVRFKRAHQNLHSDSVSNAPDNLSELLREPVQRDFLKPVSPKWAVDRRETQKHLYYSRDTNSTFPSIAYGESYAQASRSNGAVNDLFSSQLSQSPKSASSPVPTAPCTSQSKNASPRSIASANQRRPVMISEPCPFIKIARERTLPEQSRTVLREQFLRQKLRLDKYVALLEEQQQSRLESRQLMPAHADHPPVLVVNRDDALLCELRTV